MADRTLGVESLDCSPEHAPSTLGIRCRTRAVLVRPSMPAAFQEHTTVTDGGLLLNGIVCRVILLSGYVLCTA